MQNKILLSIASLIILGIPQIVFGQNQSSATKTKVVGDSLYQSNIKKSRLYGVYIPKDIDDAVLELEKLSSPEAQKKFRLAEENLVAQKLRFGIGRWMEYNWNFEEGSRLSHLLREKGINHSDDMVHFMLIIFHRHLNKKDLNIDILANEIIEKRKALIKAQQDKNTIETIQKN